MIRQFSRKVEKSNIKDLKKKGRLRCGEKDGSYEEMSYAGPADHVSLVGVASGPGGAPAGHTKVSKSQKGDSRLAGMETFEYRPGMLDRVSDLTQREGVKKKMTDFEGKLDSTLSFASDIKSLKSPSFNTLND